MAIQPAEQRGRPPLKEPVPPQLEFDTWKESDVPGIIALEQKVWPPWLQKSPDAIKHIARNYSDTQFLIRKDSQVVATLTTTRFDWDGNLESLTTWDAIAGAPVADSSYNNTYKADGNTLCLMAANVDPEVRGERLAPRLIEHLQAIAPSLGVTRIVSSFRPSGYGEYKLQNLDNPVSFEEYCRMTREKDGKLHDPWLRSVSELGMQPLRVEERAMVVEVSRGQFEKYRETYNPKKWKPTKSGVVECGETGNWEVVGGRARYVEPNLWGEIPLKPPQAPRLPQA